MALQRVQKPSGRALGSRAGLLISLGSTLAGAAVGLLIAEDLVLGVAAGVMILGGVVALIRPEFLAGALFVTIFGEYLGAGDITLARLGAPLAVVTIALGMFRGPTNWVASVKTLNWIALYVGLAVVSMVWTKSPETTSTDLMLLAFSLAYAFALPAVIKSTAELRAVILIAATASTGLALWWIYTFLAGISRFENVAGDPNFFSAYQVAMLPLVVVTATHSKTSFARGSLYCVAGLITASIVTTLSRGGLATLLIVGGLMALSPARAIFGNRARKGFFLFLALIALAGVLSVAWLQLEQRIGTEHGRLGIWDAAITGYVENPITGLGYGAFRGVSYELMSSTPGVDLKQHAVHELLSGRQVHSAYLGTLAELGIGGLIAFVGLLIATIRSFLTTARRGADNGDHFLYSLGNAGAVGFVALCAASIFLTSEGKPILWAMIGLSIAMAALPAQGAPQNEIDERPR